MITKLRIGWLAVAVGLGASAETAAAQSCPTCTASGGIREKIGSLCGLRPASRASCPPSICPGSCFGYIKPQWTAWNQACPNWGANGVEPPIGGVAQPVPVAVPAALPPAPTNTTPPATTGSVPTLKPNDVAPAPAPAAPPAVEPAPPPKPVPSSKTFVPIPALPPQPINTRLPLPPTPDLPRS